MEILNLIYVDLRGLLLVILLLGMRYFFFFVDDC